MIDIIIGSPEVAAIEYIVEVPMDEGWVFGQFRLHVRGYAIGNWSDCVTLLAVANWWRTFAGATPDRWDTALDGLDALGAFRVVDDAVYGNSNPLGLVDAYGRYHISQLGMSAFDQVRMVLLEPPGKGQWLVWRDSGTDALHDVALPAMTLQSLGARFVDHFDSEVSARRRG